MDFNLSKTQEMTVKMVAEFAEKELAPSIAERDEHEIFDLDIMAKLGQVGLMGVPYPKEYGGAGAGDVAYALSVAELAKVDPSTAIGVSVHTSLATWPIFKYGNAEQKAKYLPRLTTGQSMGSFGLTEPNAGTDVSGAQTTAVLDGDHYVLNGTKIFITNAGDSEIYVVFGLTDKSKGPKGMSAFIVEKGTPGFTFGKPEVKMGIRASVQRELSFENCRVPKENLLGKEGDGFKIAMTTLDGGRIGVAAQSLGIAEGAYNLALQYSKERKQFGKPISAQQWVNFTLADMKMRIEAARHLVMKAAWTKESGKPYSEEAAIAKCFASDVAMWVTTNAVQIHGGYGYTREYSAERFMRDAKICQIYEGTNQAMRMIVAGSILR
ncbi:acyl-CoA dehydrogenase [Serpentinicella alkaliphila]|uniref:Alkylation response protein AidB-like acyl-CoA dehydrogenase n=1 Tax=Serpentinicella alkaliphila TaxID=1734049 RepID=A0A4R2TWF7_9FIRM|nr:acyl-CoA dehydrogenase [Serpentinicella alkaliphila]QUH25894.1 acyl-CoA dehydrogenase [Serpentinicella alkaliphila]TCQ01959.1 alkylation response protein AidB-like acyl-CoA dehydrogenase [Serpentinicella alkaliphila]